MLPQTPRGNFVYEPDGEVLTEYFWDNWKFSCIQGPIGSGTSSASCMKIWRIACDQAPDYDGVRRTKWIVTRTTYKELRDTTIETWLAWFPESEWGNMIRSEPAYHTLSRAHPSGDGTTVECHVSFTALPDQETARRTLASNEITGFFVNEGQNVEKGVITELLSRCSRYPPMKSGPGPTWFGGFMDMNAPVEGHWVPYMRGDVPIPKDLGDGVAEDYAMPNNWRFYVQPPGLIERKIDGKIVYLPNPKAENQKWLTEPYIEKIKGWRKADIDTLVLNKVLLSTGGKAVYPTFSEYEHVAPDEQYAVPGATIICGLDFGRDPAAGFAQCVNGRWTVLSELIGDNESAQLFAPRVKRHLAQKYPGHKVEFWGDPRGADGTQSTETTAYDVFQSHGMRVFPATSDNNPEMRRSTVEAVLERRNGFFINPSCITAKTGFAGGYHYPKIKGLPGVYSERPRKNRYSHIVEAIENALLGGGEGDAIILGSKPKPKASKPFRHRVSLRRSA